ncbi:MAG TPA: hypothetical protein VMD59_18620, partial [Acidimicrobiales bacterium]|nr:hypothetical protein [Acidimicrobiales bacterium]
MVERGAATRWSWHVVCHIACGHRHVASRSTAPGARNTARSRSPARRAAQVGGEREWRRRVALIIALLPAGMVLAGLGPGAGPSLLLGAPPVSASPTTWSGSTVAPPSELTNLSPLPQWIACPTAGTCLAVGGYSTGAGLRLGLIVTGSSGSWAAAGVPEPPGVTSPPAALSSISCPSATTCVAVGNDLAGQGLILTDSSGSWSSAIPPLPAGASTSPNTRLTAIACQSSTSCVAVGYYTDSSFLRHALVLTDSSGTWSAIEAPLPANAGTSPNAELETLACPSSTSCAAAGTYQDSSHVTHTVVETDASGSWSAIEDPLPSGASSAQSSVVTSVACPSATACLAVGYYLDSSSVERPLLLTDSSGSWSAAEAPYPSGAPSSSSAELEGESCPSATACVAVGYYLDSSSHDQPLLLTGSSGSWSAALGPLPSGASANPAAIVSDVSCASSTACVAAGTYHDSSGNTQGMLLADSSGSWSASEAPLPSGASSNPSFVTTQLACASSSSCALAGSYASASGAQGLLLADSSGSWSAASAPEPSGAAPSPSGALKAVACSGATSCVAVGDYQDSAGNMQGLLASESAGSWSATEAPVPSGAAADPEVVLTMLACPATTSCVALGTYQTSGGSTLGVILTDSSGSWTAVTAPSPSGAASLEPIALACASATRCVAVGFYQDSSGNMFGLLLTDSSGSWSAAKAPVPSGANTGDPLDSLEAVACASPTSCVADGSYVDTSYVDHGVVLTDSSGSWSAAEAPIPTGSPSSSFAELMALSCPSSSGCTGLGWYIDANGYVQGLIETDSSGTWSASKAPVPAGASSDPGAYLSAVSCASVTSCAGFGQYDDASSDAQGLLLTDSSGTWTATEAPLPAGAAGNPGVAPSAISCAVTTCAAAGTYLDASGSTQGLLLVDSAGTWSATAAPLPSAAPNPEVSTAAVTCLGSGSCDAIGKYWDSGYGLDPLLESYAPPCSAGSGSAGCALTTTVSVQGGTLAVEASPQLYWDVVLNGYDQWEGASASTLSGCSAGTTGTSCAGGSAPVLEVTDATGSGSGWAVSAYLSGSDLPAGAALDFGGAGSPTPGSSLDDPLSSYPYAPSAPSTVCDHGSACTP